MVDYKKIEETIRGRSTLPRMWHHKLDNPAEHMMPLWDMVRKYFQHDFSVVEIGVFNGGATELFAMWCQKVYAVDPWADGPYLDQAAGDTGNANANLIEAERLFDKLEYGNIVKLRMTSEEAKGKFKNNSLDVIYIDGDHRYESVLKDINWWLPKIKKGGFISGHDYYDDPEKAVLETLGKPDEIFEESSWIKEIK